MNTSTERTADTNTRCAGDVFDDLDALSPGRGTNALTEATSGASGRLPKCGTMRRRGFLKGPIPLPWLQRAASMPGKVLAVGIAIWTEAGMKKLKTIPLPRRRLRQFGVQRWAARRCLAALEAAGLVTVERTHGRAPRVTIVTDDIDHEDRGS